MASSKTTFSKVLQILKGHYGKLEPLQRLDAFSLILFEGIAYLAQDTQRQAAFAALRDKVGLRPVDILAVPLDELIRVTRLGGIHAEHRASRLKESAHIVVNDFGGDLSTVLEWPLPQAIKALKKFPSIGEPGAEKILLFTRTYPILALESNGLRVVLRLGFGEEKRDYSASYKSARTALQDQVGDDCDSLIAAHQLLRRLGKEICKTTSPLCRACPLNRVCHYYISMRRKAVTQTAS